ncbi:uncharacterized protein LOC129579219 isoform X2 [Sitodiplosis mosellana]|uniref:uncharacterized protein LOC129579219 isoform X2 n=1 Tax=Sitodiplosis mosellana TaxID=263140 RepID=UPI002444E042|nr:uncharacterized protein LOC129579219 isoform X2 [Sitodiplosis mosellana]
MCSARSFVYMLLSTCSIDYALGCYRITQNNPELLRYVEFDRVATNVNITSGSNIIDCLGLENQLQKIHISWTPSEKLPEHFNVTVQSDDKDFFAKKTIPGNQTEASFGVLITPTRKYNISIEADARLTTTATFIIEKERPCLQINPYVWIGICTFAIVLSFILTYKCQTDYDESQDEDNKKSQYAKNLTEGNKLSLNTATKKDNANNKQTESADDKLNLIA